MNTYFRSLILNRIGLIDVRAPVEFNEGSFPHSISSPILNDEERKEIGTLYKTKGKEEAIKRGHELVSGEIKAARLEAWIRLIRSHPDVVLCCFRGGLRSQIAQKWLKEAGFEVPLIKGGYKALRRFLIEQTEAYAQQKMMVLSGTTGSGKTEFIKNMKNEFRCLDLEALANHRGSSFGALGTRQPCQVNYENALAAELIRLDEMRIKIETPLLVEDESRLIGKCIQPEIFYNKFIEAPVVVIQKSLPERVEQIFKEYVLENTQLTTAMYESFEQSMNQISKKLGSLRHAELIQNLKDARKQFDEMGNHDLNRVWIEKALSYYYDPIYLRSLEKKKARVIFQGNQGEVAGFLRSQI